ncbi:MAG: hypothetical protein ACK5HO_00230 [Pseudomonadota bacterium]
MNNIQSKVVAAMTACGMAAIGEGALYYALFKLGISPDDATMAVREMLDNGTLRRSGCALLLCGYVPQHADEGAYRTGSFCNS